MMGVLFWIFILIITYVYFGYPLLIFIFSRIHPAPAIQKGDITPTVSLIIAAFNEEKFIAQKIENSLSLNYPREKIDIIVASDGSTDRTNKIVSRYQIQGVKLITLGTNQGKSTAQNCAMDGVHGDIALFTDANAMLLPKSIE